MTNNRGREEEEEEEEKKKKGQQQKRKGMKAGKVPLVLFVFLFPPFHESPLHFFVPFSPFSPHLSSFFTL